MKKRYPLRVRLYLAAQKRFAQLKKLSQIVFDAFWLGWLDSDVLDLIDESFHDSNRYHTDTYNKLGLWEWEKKAVDTHFKDCGRLLVSSAGGGREMIALCELGYEVHGFECHPALVSTAERLLRESGCVAEVELVARNECPDGRQTYDGLIIGWGSYSLIQSRTRRVSFLRAMRDKVAPRSPLLVSFFYRSTSEKRFKIYASIGNGLRWIRRKPPIELGDSLVPNYAHHFTQAEISSELSQAGFDLFFYETRDFGHAVAFASDTGLTVGSAR